MKLDYVHGHCGWDAVTLLLASQVPEHKQIEVALRVLDQKGGLEVGYLDHHPDGIRLRIVDSTTRNFVSMCGGLTQVLGLALGTSRFGQEFGFNGTGKIKLITDSGVVPISVSEHGTVSDMSSYADLLYGLGVWRGKLNGIAVLHVGEYFVINIKDLNYKYPRVDFTRRTCGPHLEIVNSLLGDLPAAILWDEGGEFGCCRLYPRFLDKAAMAIPYEFQCGTGMTAAAVGLCHLNMLDEEGCIVFEWGNNRVTPDPYGIRRSEVWYQTKKGRIDSIKFRHSATDIFDVGTVEITGR